MKNFPHRFARLFYIAQRECTSKNTEDDKFANYESPIDYQSLGEAVYEQEVNSPKFSQRIEYRDQIQQFGRLYGKNTKITIPDDVKCSSTVSVPITSEQAKDVSKIEEEHILERRILGEKMSTKFFRNWDKEPEATVVHFPFRPLKGKSKEILRQEDSDFTLKNAVQREVFAKPWITTYGILPDSPFSIFSAEIGIQRNYDHKYLKLMWEKLSPFEMRTYEKAFEFACSLKQKSRKDIHTINQTFKEFFSDDLTHLVQQQNAFQALKPQKKSVRLFLLNDLRMDFVPPKFIDFVKSIHDFQKKDATSALKRLCEIRVAQIRQNMLSE